MHDTPRSFARKTAAVLVALSLALSVLGPVGTVAAQPSVTVTQSADATTVAPGDSVSLTTEFTVTELNAPQLQTSLPDGWTIESQSATGPVAFSDGTWTWLAGDEDGVNVSYTVEYTVAVPEDASTGDYTLAADGSALSPGGASTADSAATTVTVQEEPENEAPSAAFDATPATPVTGEAVTFDAASSTDADGTIESYEWDFDGDGTTDATGEEVTNTFDDPGDYDVALTVTDDDGATDTTTQTVSVGEAPTAASFQLSGLTVESPVTQGDAASVTATVENTGDEAGTQTVGLSVDGDQTDTESVTLAGGASQQVDFTVDTSSLDADDYDVTVSTDDDSASGTLTVDAPEPPANEAPTAAFDASPTDPEPGESVAFDAADSTDADGSVASYEWAFGDGNTATGVSPTHAYDEPGDYDVTLTVTDDDGATDTTTQTVSVAEPSDPGEPGDAPSTDVSLSPSDDLVAVNGSTTFDVVVEDADGGVGAYSLSVSLADSSAASIADVSVDEDALADVQIADDGSSASVDTALLDTEQNGSVTVATVTVAGDAEGASALELDVGNLGTETGAVYDVTATNDATLSVSELVVGPSDQPAQDPDDDGVYEDVNGDGVVDELDVQVLFGGRDSQVVQNSPAAFDFNGDGTFDVLDVQALYHEEVA
jgi:PKD repeat protein